MQVTNIAIDEQKQINGAAFPLVLGAQPEANGSLETCLAWVRENREELRSLMLRHGAVLLRNFPVAGAEAFEALLDAAAFENMPYLGGAAPREQVTKGRVLTANESPPSAPIPFHHEMAQVPKPPAYVFFYCDIEPESGGETTIVHSHRVYQRFADASPEFAAKVEELGVRYIRIMPDQDDATSPIGRSWRSTFQTNDPATAEIKMKEIGTTWHWQDNGNLHTETATVPAIRQEPRSGMKTFFNSMVAAYTGWTDSRNDPKRAVVCGDGSAVDEQAILETEKAMAEECVAFKWQQGDVLLVDNSLVMHARRPYSGQRRILASIATS